MFLCGKISDFVGYSFQILKALNLAYSYKEKNNYSWNLTTRIYFIAIDSTLIHGSLELADFFLI